MLAILICAACLVAGVFWPGVMLAGILFTYQAASISGYEWVTTVYAAGAIPVAIWHYFRARPSLAPNWVDLTYLTFIFGYAATTFYAVVPDAAQAAAVKLLLAAISMYAVGRITISPRNADRVIIQFVIGALVAGAAMSAVLYQAAQASGTSYWSRLSVGGATAVGTAQPLPMALIAAVLAGVWCVANKRWALLAGVLALGGWILYICVLSGTRGIFIAAGAGLIVATIVGRRVAPWARMIGMASIAAVAGLLVIPRLEQTKRLTYSFDRLIGNFQEGGMVMDLSARLRLEQQTAAFELFSQKTKFGAGIGGFDAITHKMYPHNLELEIGAEFGLIGLMLLTFYLIALFRRQVTIATYQPMVGIVLLAMSTSCVIHQQISFSFFMAKPLFMFTGLTASALVSMRAAAPQAMKRPSRRNIRPAKIA